MIYLPRAKRKRQGNGWFEKWTLHGLLAELDAIELFESSEQGRLVGEITSN